MQNTLKTALKTIQMLEKELKAIANNQSGCQSYASTETPHVTVLRDVSNSRRSQEVKEKPSRKPLKRKFTDNLINPQDVVRKYKKYLNPSDLPRFTVKLAREAFIGESTMSQCTVQGQRAQPALPPDKLESLQQFVKKLSFPTLFAEETEFDDVWKTCLNSLGQACKNCRSK